MKNKSLLPILLLAALTLGACNLGGQSSKSKEEAGTSEVQQGSEDTTQYGVVIANKETLQGDWFVGSSKDLDLTLSPAANPLLELGKNLTVTSSDPTVVAVTGLGLSALKAGNAKITVKYHEATDDVDVVILENTPQGKYGVEHDGTLESPFTNEEAILAAKSPRYAGEDYYVKGIVDSFYHAPGSRDDGACSFFLAPAQENGERFEVYKCYKEGTGAASYLTTDDIWKGGEVIAHGKFTVYNNTQAETTSAVFVSCTGNKPEAPKVLEKTFAETLADGVALKDGDSTYDSYKFRGYVAKKSGNDFYLTATKGEALVSGKSDAAHGERDIYTNAIELYGAGKVAELAAKLLDGALVEVTMVVKNYHGTVENGNTLADADVTVVTPGTPWAVPEPEVTNRTIAEFIAGENTKAKAYIVTGTIKDWGGATSSKGKYGNMTLTDGTNDLLVYGASATATALAWDNSEAYAFTNPQDFLTNEITASLAIGNEITMKLIRADFTKDGVTTIEGTGVITAVTPVAATAIALDQATAEVEIGATVKLTATLTPANSNSAVTWHSSDDTIATVNNGLVAGVAAGQATITAKVSDEIKAECVVTVNAPASAPVALPADGLTINPAALDLATNNTYDKNKNREVTVNGMNLVLDPESAGSVTKASAPYTSTGAVGVDCIQFKKGGLIAIRTKDRLEAAVQATVIMYTYGYATEAKGYLPAFKLGASADPILANETNGGTVAVAGVDTGKVYNDKGTEKIIYEYTLTYDLSALHEETLTLVTAESGAAYVGSIVISNQAAAQPEIAQPTGAFRGLAKSKAGTFLPVDMILAADSVTLNANGEAVAVTSYEWDKVEGQITIVTDAAGYGTIVAKLDSENNLFQITSINGTAALASLDLTYAVKLSGKCQFLDCEGSTAELQAMFLRRKMGSSGWEAANADDKIFSSENGKNGKGLSVKCWADGKIALTMKNDVNIPAASIKSVGCWIYNPSSTAYSTNLYFYPSAGNQNGKMVKTISLPAGQWTFCECGVAGGSFGDSNTFYNFQFYTENVNTTLVFDNFCIYM